MNKLKIDKNVPLPAVPGKRTSKYDCIPFSEMALGDSVLYVCKKPADEIGAIRSIAYTKAKTTVKYSYSVRPVENGIRVWCVKKNPPRGGKKAKKNGQAHNK